MLYLSFAQILSVFFFLSALAQASFIDENVLKDQPILVNQGLTLSHRYGKAMVSVSDQNNDQVEDLLISGINAHSGSVLLVSLRDREVLKIFPSPADNVGSFLHATSQFGQSITSGFDADGDGHNDFAISAPKAKNFNGVETGAVFIYSGNKTPSFGPPYPLITILFGTQLGERFGQSITTVKDINSDEFDDLAVGAPGAQIPGSLSFPPAGAVFFFSMKHTGGAQITRLDNDTIFGTLTPGAAGSAPQGEQLGTVVKNLGFFDAGLTEDLGVVAGNLDELPQSPPKVKIIDVAGNTLHTLLDRAHDVILVGDIDGDSKSEIGIRCLGCAHVTVNGSTPKIGFFRVYNGNNAFQTHYTLSGNTAEQQFGSSIQTTTDLNGDGISEVLVSETGRVKVYSGLNGSLTSLSYTLRGPTHLTQAPTQPPSGTGDIEPGPPSSYYTANSILSVADINGDDQRDWVFGIQNLALSSSSSIQSGGYQLFTSQPIAPTQIFEDISSNCYASQVLPQFEGGGLGKTATLSGSDGIAGGKVALVVSFNRVGSLLPPPFAPGCLSVIDPGGFQQYLLTNVSGDGSWSATTFRSVPTGIDWIGKTLYAQLIHFLPGGGYWAGRNFKIVLGQ